ncbi:MAG: aminoacyl-tRNA hydrolase [Burkholderiales bacterium]
MAALQLGVRIYRRVALQRVTFVAVTGSCGKTTTKELIAAVLASTLEGTKSRENLNLSWHLVGTVFRARPWHDYCVVEVAAAVRGERIPLEGPLAIARPSVGLVTNIGSDHLSVFRTLEETAAEKGKLIAALPANGIALINIDDVHVRSMERRCTARQITFGLAPEAMMRADGIHAAWPEPLSFTVHYNGASQVVRTQLYGEHWVSCVLAALAVGLAMEVPLAAAIAAVGTVAPFSGRMSPTRLPDGITFLRDDVKASLWSYEPALRFMRDAQARRKTVIVGTISDYAGNSDRTFRMVAREALAAADRVVFVGPHASKCLKARRHPQDDALLAFYSVHAGCEYLRTRWEPGDLVLLKGAEKDGLNAFIESAIRRDVMDSLATAPDWRVSDSPVQFVAGLGNPGSRYEDTPHNVGQRVVDEIARFLGGTWREEGSVAVAQIEWQGQMVCLAKPLTQVNLSGPPLLRLAQDLGVGPAECILVHDDLDLLIGRIGVRDRGGDAGHRGVRSVLNAFGTDQVRRIRVGVGRPNRKAQAADDVVAPFPREEGAAIATARREAADAVLRLVAEYAKPSVRSDEGGDQRHSQLTAAT